MDTLIEGKRSGEVDPDLGRALEGRVLPPRRSQRGAEAQTEVPARSDVASDLPVCDPPFLGARVAKGISIDDIASYLNETALFRNQWQFRPEKGDSEPSETDADFKDRIRAVLRDQLDRAKAEGLLVPAVAWGYFPVNADGDDLVVWAEDGRTLAGLFRQQYRGSRYSWGYPACPDLEDQTKVAELLDIERIGVSLTEEFHLVPEQSTSAIVVPHPEAKYFIA